jgi:hypothetical protein
MMGIDVGVWIRRNWWQAVVLPLGGWCGFYFALILPMHFQYSRQMAAQRGSGLAAVAGYDPVSLWRQSSVFDVFRPPQIAAQRGRRSHPYGMYLSAASELPNEDSSAENRYIVRFAEFELEVKSPADCAEKVRALAEEMNGYLVSSEIGNDQYAPGRTITVRVPASRFEEMRSELRKLAVRVTNEKVDANDVTKDYVDREAQLRNLQAQEARYLAILQRAATVKDTLDVSDKLSQVRGQIEQQRAEFATLAKQVETVAINLSLRAEADTQVFGVRWRPLYELKLAARDGLDSFATYAAVMTAAIFRLPAFLLWVATFVLFASIAWRSTRWVRKTFFVSARP